MAAISSVTSSSSAALQGCPTPLPFEERISQLCLIWDEISREFEDCPEIRREGANRGMTERYPVRPNLHVGKRMEALAKQALFLELLIPLSELVDQPGAKEKCAVLAAKIQTTISHDSFSSFPDAIRWVESEVKLQDFEWRNKGYNSSVEYDLTWAYNRALAAFMCAWDKKWAALNDTLPDVNWHHYYDRKAAVHQFAICELAKLGINRYQIIGDGEPVVLGLD